jgi:hypothetical protein
MTSRTALILALLLGAAAPLSSVAAQTPAEVWQADRVHVFDGTEVTLEEFLWIARPIVVFADTPADPRFQQQMALIEARKEVLAARDVVVIVDTDPAERSAVRTKLRPRGFMLALLEKDGTVFQRKPAPWDVREISRAIDKLPQRQQEIRSGAPAGG